MVALSTWKSGMTLESLRNGHGSLFFLLFGSRGVGEGGVQVTCFSLRIESDVGFDGSV